MLLKTAPAPASQRLLEEFERTGCSRAFDSLVTLHRDEVYAICQRMLRDAHEAEDATQAVFLTLALQARGGNSIDCVPAWLRKVARHVSLDLIKARKRRKHHEDAARQRRPGVSDDEDATRAADSGELKDILARHLQELPDSYRTPVVLFYFGGMSLPQISRQLGVKPKALGVRLLRARRMLAERLSGNFPWFAVAAVPILLQEAVRGGALAPPQFASAGLISALQVTQASVFRRIGIASFAIAILCSSAGSATMYFAPDAVRTLQKSLPILRNWKTPTPVPVLRLDNTAPAPEPATPMPPVAPERSIPVPLPLATRDLALPALAVGSTLPTPPPSAFRSPDHAVPTSREADAPPLVLAPSSDSVAGTDLTPFPHLASLSRSSREVYPTLALADGPIDDVFASAIPEGIFSNPAAPFPTDDGTDAGASTMTGADDGLGAVPEPTVLPWLVAAGFLLRRRRYASAENPRL